MTASTKHISPIQTRIDALASRAKQIHARTRRKRTSQYMDFSVDTFIDVLADRLDAIAFVCHKPESRILPAAAAALAAVQAAVEEIERVYGAAPASLVIDTDSK